MKFEKYHPFINLLFFVSVIVFSILFNHPIFLIISYLCSFIYSVKLNGKKGFIFNVACILFIVIYPFIYSSYCHFGITVLTTNFIENNITLESLIYGLVISIIVVSVIMWFSCINTVFSSDKIIYLFGKVSHNLSLYLAIILRTMPQIKDEFKKTANARKCIGKGIKQKNILKCIKNFANIISIVITWTIENFIEKANSMNNRGYKLKDKTTFSIYRFDNRDRSFIILMFFLLTIISVGIALEQTTILYNPQIIFVLPTSASYIFYIAYVTFSLLPFTAQTINEIKFKKLCDKIKSF
ncbi:MAG: energy-coupling factor transporter transmembrane component T [Oscillospiraceae bacterium]